MAENVRENTPETTQVEFRAEIQQLLDILVHSLYTNKEIFLRELLSNASDALNRIKFEMLTNHDVLDPEAELAIYIEADEDKNTLTIRDSGVGMTQEELAENLGTIARSGAKGFLKALEEVGKKSQAVTTDIIGQFGVGFYSLRQVVKNHSDFVAFPIYLKEEKPGEEEGETKTEETQINEQTAIWRQSPREIDEEKYQNFYRQFTLDFGEPLLRVHTSADAPVQFYALLFVPSKKDYRLFGAKEDYGLKLCARKVLIKENFKELLPNYLRFVEGVVDSEDIPLNVSREMVQATPLLEKIKSILVCRLAGELETLAEEKPDAYRTFWNEFGSFIKEGIATDPDSKGKFTSLLRFPSSKSENTNDLMSLEQYVNRMRPVQSEIYYIRLLAGSPPALFLTDATQDRPGAKAGYAARL